MTTRRDFITKASYAVPTILTLGASPAFAGSGSNKAKGGTANGRQKRNGWVRKRRRWRRRGS